eukprot:4075719-Amphidinium_carterae.1
MRPKVSATMHCSRINSTCKCRGEVVEGARKQVASTTATEPVRSRSNLARVFMPEIWRRSTWLHSTMLALAMK